METVNLTEILKKTKVYSHSGLPADLLWDDILLAMVEACEQVIDLCAENATMNGVTMNKREDLGDTTQIFVRNDNSDDEMWIINEQSIRDTKKQILITD